jgi:hypothetical protein
LCGAFLFMEERLLCHIIIQPEIGAIAGKKIAKQIVSAYKWDNEKGPVICFCNENAYEYLVRNGLDEKLYLDVIVTSDKINEEKAKELIGGDDNIEFQYPFLAPFWDKEEIDSKINDLPENYQELCREAISKELNLSAL